MTRKLKGRVVHGSPGNLFGSLHAWYGPSAQGRQQIDVIDASTITHEGNPRKTLLEALNRFLKCATSPLQSLAANSLILFGLTTISEPEAVERAVAQILPRTIPIEWS